MRLKIFILTILVCGLVFLSLFVVISDIKDRTKIARTKNLTFAIINASQASENFNSQTGYILPVSEPTYFPIRSPNFSEPALTAKSFILYDTKNSKVLLEKNSQQQLPIASLTKILTAVVALEKLSSADTVEITKESMNTDGEGADFYLGERFYFKDLFKAMLVKSSNDAASAIARKVEQKTGVSFIQLMNEKSTQIGMTNSQFLDSSGLNDKAYSTAEDLIKLLNFSKMHKEIRDTLMLASVDISSVAVPPAGGFKHHFSSTNKLLGVFPNLAFGKTGYTDGALGCIILEENLPEVGSSLVVAVLGSNSKFDDARTLLEWGKTAFRWK